MFPSHQPELTPVASHVSVTIVSSTTTADYPPPPSPVATPSHTTENAPPAYLGRASSVTPLSFFPESTRTSHVTVVEIESSNVYDQAPPPSYRSVPRTHAERCFWWGFLLFPAWILGIARLCRPENMIGRGKHAFAPSPTPLAHRRDDTSSTTLEADLLTCATSSNPAASVYLWREEERLWAMRCLWTFCGFCVLAATFGTVVGTMIAQQQQSRS